MRLVLGGLAFNLLMLRDREPARYASQREAITVVAYFQEASPTNTAFSPYYQPECASEGSINQHRFSP
jgi:hypothetical protein